MQAVLARQAADGWLGPEVGAGRNLWARYPLLLGLVQLVEADPAVWEAQVLDATWRFVGLMGEMLRDGSRGYLWREGEEDGGLSEEEFTWGRVRVQDLLIVLQWLWERDSTTDAGRDELASSMRILIDGSINWADWWQEGVFIKEDLNFLDTEPSNGPRYPYEHGVNAGQGKFRDSFPCRLRNRGAGCAKVPGVLFSGSLGFLSALFPGFIRQIRGCSSPSTFPSAYRSISWLNNWPVSSIHVLNLEQASKHLQSSDDSRIMTALWKLPIEE